MDLLSPENQVRLLRQLVFADIGITGIAFATAMLGATIWGVGETGPLTGGEVAVATLGCAMLVVVVPAIIVSWVGLLSFSAWSRWLYLWAHVAAYLLWIPIAAFDFTARWTLPEAIAAVGGPVSGAIVVLVFMTQVAQRFAPVESQNGSKQKVSSGTQW